MKQSDADLREDVLDERKQAIAATAIEVGTTFSNEYDFGDGWEHRIVVERIERIDEPVGYARVLAGERACPPEDVGGPGGSHAVVPAIKTPTGPHQANPHPY